MKVYVYTLTRDRLEYTKRAFDLLKKKAGYPYKHIVVDNGSEDGTEQWLQDNEDEFERLMLNDSNKGISHGSNQALDWIRLEEGRPKEADLVIKMDNDCEIISDNIILELVCLCYEVKHRKPLGTKYILSPNVKGIIKPPERLKTSWWTKHKVSTVCLVGGLFHAVPWEVYRDYKYPMDLPLAWGQDDYFCDWFNGRGGRCAYVETLWVGHMDGTEGQAKKYPDYFERKKEEMKPCPKD